MSLSIYRTTIANDVRFDTEVRARIGTQRKIRGSAQYLDLVLCRNMATKKKKPIKLNQLSWTPSTRRTA